MRDWFRPVVSQAIPLGAGLAATLVVIAFMLRDPGGIVTSLRERAFDVIVTAMPRSPGSGKVVVVDIDQKSLDRFGDWPIARSDMADLTKHIAAAQPAAIGFDIFFEGPDRRSAHTLADEISHMPGGATIAPLVAAMPDNDRMFADVLGQVPSVLGALAAPSGQPTSANPVRVTGRLGGDDVVVAGGVAQPYGPLADAAFSLGIQFLIGEDGGIVRRVPLLVSAANVLVPGLALETARVASQATFLDVDAARQTLQVGIQTLPLGDGGSLRLHWSKVSDWQSRTISAVDLVDGKIASSRLAGAAVLIGSSAPQAGALRPTAVEPLTPTVQIEAEALGQILDGDAPARPANVRPVETGAALLLGLMGTAAATFGGPVVAAATLAGLALAWIAGSVASFAAARWLVDPIGPLVPLACASLLVAAMTYARTRRLKALITGRFAQYVAPAVVREIVAHPERLKRVGEMRDVTALFTDIEEFTALTARLEARVLIGLLDRYFVGVCAIVTEHGGLIDAIAGDAVHVLFNVPLEQRDHADLALDCAAAIGRFADGFAAHADVQAAGFGRTRIGIETGPAIVGDVGGAGRLNFTAHGTVINMASRLEAANKQFGSTICVGPGAAASVRRTKLTLLGDIELRGVGQVCAVYTVASA